MKKVNHRYAVVVQDLATQWIQSYPCKTKNSQETERSMQKFMEPDGNVKISLGIIAGLHHTGRKQKGLLKEQCAE